MINQIIETIKSIFFNTVSLLMPIYIVLIVFCICVYVYQLNIYKKSIYYKEKKTSFNKILKNKGERGEYRTSQQIEKILPSSKMLFNIYINKVDKENETTEIDILTISKYGIYVIENKNYKGWIFGDENSKKWCQQLGKNKKFFFYNPIKQNNTHIESLKKIFNENNIDKNIQSIICFNSDATFKKMNIISKDIIVTKSIELYKYIDKNKEIMTEEEVDKIYKIIKPYTNVTEEKKQEHIDNINNKYKSKQNF